MIYNDNPLQYSSLENPIDRGAWQATIHGLAESDMTEHTLNSSWKALLWFKPCHFRNISALRSYYHVLFNGMNEKRNKICKSVVYFSSLSSSSISPPFPSSHSLFLCLSLSPSTSPAPNLQTFPAFVKFSSFDDLCCCITIVKYSG